MTNQEAICLLDILRVFDAPALSEAIQMAIAALREQDSLAKKTSDKKTSEWISVEERLPEPPEVEG